MTPAMRFCLPLLLCLVQPLAFAHGDTSAFVTREAPDRQDAAAGVQRYPARVRIDPRYTASVVLKVSARIVNMGDLYVGRPVSKGEVLAEFESPGLETIQRTYAELYSNLEYAKAFSNTVEKKLIEARMDLRWRGLSKQDLRLLESSLKPVGRIQIRAPRDGYLTRINVTEGQVVNPGARPGLFSLNGTTLFRIAEPKAVLVEAALPLAAAASLRPGDAAWLYLPAEDAPVAATVERVVPVSRPGSPRRTVRLRLLDGDALSSVWGGLRVSVSFEPAETHHAH